MTIKFLLSKKNPSNKVLLQLTCSSENINFQFNTDLYIAQDEWDNKNQRPKNIYLKEHKKLNARLILLRIELTEYLEKKKKQKKPIVHRSVSRRIRQLCKSQPTTYQHPENALIHFTNLYIDLKQNFIAASTLKRYNVFLHLLERFEGFLCKRLLIEEINSDFIKDFMKFGKQEKYSDNTIYRTIHFVKTILNFAERKGIRTAVRELEIRREKQQQEFITLSEKEISKIKNTDVPQGLQAAKDWLLISCYTGQRFSDFMCFETRQLKTVEGKICLSFVQKKTKKKILLPLHPTVVHILQKNGGIFPQLMDIQHYNFKIKEIARLACLNETVHARRRFGFRSHHVEIEKCEILSSHIGRRSFATNFYGKIPTPLLMGATGHSTEQIFLRYINPADNDRILSLSRYFDSMDREQDVN